MRFHLGAVPTSPDFMPDGKWRPLRELGPFLVQIIAIPIGIIITGLLVIFWYGFTPLQNIAPVWSLPAFHRFMDGLSIPTLLLLLLVMASTPIVHELIHAAVHPRAGRSPHTVLGFWPATLLFYAFYDGELTCKRLIAILLLPLLVISILPLIVAAVCQVASGWVAFVSCFNAFASCVDILGASLLWFQVPRTAIVRNQGWRTYWKERETAPDVNSGN